MVSIFSSLAPENICYFLFQFISKVCLKKCVELSVEEKTGKQLIKLRL
jgi:hypothetical protein